MARSIHSRLREIHGADVEVTLVGRQDRRSGAYRVVPPRLERPSIGAKEVINAVAVAFVALPAIAFMLLLILVLMGLASLLIYLTFSAFGAPQWIAIATAAAFDMFVLAYLWVNRR